MNFGSAEIDISRTGTVAYRSGRTERLRTVQWLDAAGNSEPLSADPAFYMFPRLSQDGNRLVLIVTRGSGTDDLWIYDMQRGNRTRLTSGTGLDSWPVWSPDGQYVVLQSTGGMFWARADGAGNARALTQSNKLQFPSSFSPDGKWLAFSELTSGAMTEIRTLHVENAAGQLLAGESEPFLKTSTANAYAAFSPDGRWLAYADSPAGNYEVYVRAFPDNGSQVQISNAGGTMPVWSRNGHEIFYRTEDQRIMVAKYTVKGQAFLSDKPRVWSRKQLANLGLTPTFDLAPDGKRVVGLMPAESPEPRESQSHVMLVTNFFDEVHRRVGSQAK